jgi:hypothetical protein
LWKSPFSPQPEKGRHKRLNIKRTVVAFFECESTVLQEFIPEGQTIKPALLLHDFATFEEGIPPKVYSITTEYRPVDSLQQCPGSH